jgi:hypothetical protein
MKEARGLDNVGDRVGDGVGSHCRGGPQGQCLRPQSTCMRRRSTMARPHRVHCRSARSPPHPRCQSWPRSWPQHPPPSPEPLPGFHPRPPHSLSSPLPLAPRGASPSRPLVSPFIDRPALAPSLDLRSGLRLARSSTGAHPVPMQLSLQ